MFFVVADAVEHPRHDELVENTDEHDHAVAQKDSNTLLTIGDIRVRRIVRFINKLRFFLDDEEYADGNEHQYEYGDNPANNPGKKPDTL